MTAPLQVATGLAKAPIADAELAAQAVQVALHKAKLKHAHSVFLVLSNEFAKQPQAAIKAAANMAGTTQVFGCTASGIFTEQEWILDCPAAAAMVFSENIFNPLPNIYAQTLSLTAPNAIQHAWLQDTTQRFGGVSGDATGLGHFSVWQNGKGVSQGYSQFGVQHGQMNINISHGVKHLSSPRKVTATQGFELVGIANIPAYQTLMLALQQHMHSQEIPYHYLMLAYAKNLKAFNQGEVSFTNIISCDEATQQVTLSTQLPANAWVSWVLRDPDTAKQEMQTHCANLAQQHTPSFGLLFSCLGRGPLFYGHQDEDILAIKQQFPNLPLIGFYGNGEIAPAQQHNKLLQYSTVLTLFESQA